jgi:hypothetical protein
LILAIPEMRNGLRDQYVLDRYRPWPVLHAAE